MEVFINRMAENQFNFGNRPSFVLLAFRILHENQVAKKGSSKSIKLSHLSTSDYFFFSMKLSSFKLFYIQQGVQVIKGLTTLYPTGCAGHLS